jgi:hypothetical protein
VHLLDLEVSRSLPMASVTRAAATLDELVRVEGEAELIGGRSVDLASNKI